MILMTKRLIVNADDYGRTPGVSKGIRRAHQKGLVTSTTAMMNMPGVEAGLRTAMRTCLHLGLGVHLVLTSGKPVLPAARVPTLTDGAQSFPGIDQQLERIDALDLNEVRLEWRAQVERFVAATHRTPDHLDSHHHFSYFTEDLFRAMLELAKEYGCPVRITLPPRRPGETGGLPDELFVKAIEYTPRLLNEFDVRHPDHFEATFYEDTVSVEYLASLLNDLLEGTTELMCHPGYADAALVSGNDLVDGSAYNRPRETELAVLTNPGLFALLAENEIKRVSFSEL